MRQVIKTDNYVKAERFIKDIIKRKAMGVVIGEKGAGKTEIKRQVIGAMEEKKGQYTVVDVMPMEEGTRNITQIMRAIIEDVSGESPRRGSEAMRRQLRRVLGDSHKEIILTIDEAQDMHKSTIRGIKKLHELGYGLRDRLFTVVLFAQNQMQGKISDDELRPRFKRQKLKELSQKEKVLFIEDQKLFTEKALKIFLSRTSNTPLAVQESYYDLEQIKDDLELSIIDEKLVREYFSKSLLDALNSLGKSNRQIAKDITEKLGLKVSATTINQHRNGKYPSDTTKLDEMLVKYVESQGVAAM